MNFETFSRITVSETREQGFVPETQDLQVLYLMFRDASRAEIRDYARDWAEREPIENQR